MYLSIDILVYVFVCLFRAPTLASRLENLKSSTNLKCFKLNDIGRDVFNYININIQANFFESKSYKLCDYEIVIKRKN